MHPKRLVPIFLAASLLLLSGCTAAGPIRIASAQKSATPIAIYPPGQIACQATMELEVADADAAAAQAASLTGNFGGYVGDSSVWFYNGQKFASLILVVPGYNFEGLYSALTGLGKLSAEKTLGLTRSTKGKYGYTQYCSISLTLKQPATAFPPPPAPGWDPLQTLQRAFAVFLSIFGFILDILIWVLVVGGPFILIGLAVWWFVRRRRKSTHSLNEKVDSA
jgi:hypothetical protein